MLARLTSLTMSSPSPRNQSLSIAATRTTRSSSPAAVLAPAALEAARHWEPRSVPRGTAPEIARCLLRSRKPMMTLHRCLLRKPATLQHAASVLMRHNLRLNSNGAPRAAMCGVRKAAATIQSAETKVKATKERVGGSTTSQVEK